MDAKPDQLVLDVATGTGMVACALRERYGCRVVGLDQSPDMLTAARDRAGVLRHDALLDFVVAPQPADDGRVVHRLGERHAVAVYPYFDDAVNSTNEEREELIEVLARLHAATKVVRDVAGVEAFGDPNRAALEQALQQLDMPWDGGPFAEPTRSVLAEHRATLHRLLEVHDAWVALAWHGEAEWVVTHGEPKLNNILVTRDGLQLVDWDTVLVAPAARDLWMADPGDGSTVAAYIHRTGRPVAEAELRLYRLRWELADIASFTRLFRGPHAQDEDTEIAWGCIADIAGIVGRWPDLV